MKKFKIYAVTYSLALIGAFSTPMLTHAQLMFSQYIDASHNRKGLEIYNPDEQSVNLADYEIRQFGNGSLSHNLAIVLSGQLASKGHFLIGRNELKTELGVSVQQVANFAFNGDDTVVLYHQGVAIDRFGRVGEQPEKGWGTTVFSKANSFKRNSNKHDVSQIDPSEVFNLEREWQAWQDRNDFSNLANMGNTAPVEEKISCGSTHTEIADLNNLPQNQAYTVRGVITADYRYSNGFSGFYLQTADTKTKPNITNAIFVYIPASSKIKGGAVGQEVMLRGQLTKYQNQLQIEQVNQDILTCADNAASWVKPIELNLPFDNSTELNANVPQRYQGMLVRLPQTLTISENYNYSRYGELVLSTGRLYIPTNVYPANSDEAKQLAQQNMLSKIILDDGYNQQNLTPWLPSTFSASDSLRTGYQIKNVQGILEYRFNSWRIQPVQGAITPQLITASNPRNSVLIKDKKLTRVAAFNVLNYDNGATGFPTARGASNQTEFDKQHAKIVAALQAIDADVFGLMEIANNGYDKNSALAYLTHALGENWKYVIPENSNKLGDDAISVAIIYNTKRVRPINTPVTLDLGDKNRTTIAQSFQRIDGGKIFTVIPNHLKSKGSCTTATGLDTDQNDGQGCWNQTRLQAVQQIIQWVAKNPTKVNATHALILGDMNAYAKEDPILTFEKANYKALLNDEKIGQGNSAYSYVYGVASNAEGYGGAGNLDHALADSALYPLVKRTFAWHINADEPTALDYNEEYKNDAQKQLFYAADAYRSSDHDPIIVDLDVGNKEKIELKEVISSGSFGLYSLFMLLIMAVCAYQLSPSKPRR